MIYEIIMPKLGETMEEGYITKWLKKEGEKIKKGEVILEVMSDKTNFEVESQHDGFLRKILFKESETPIPVTTVIGYISDSMEENIPETAQQLETRKEEKKYEQETIKIQDLPEKGRIIASPAAKRLAKELGIDIEKVKGTGEGGRIEKKDVELFVSLIQNKRTEDVEKIETLSPFRRIIAERLLESKQNIPHFYLSTKIIMDNI